jgi:hypothetical protein
MAQAIGTGGTGNGGKAQVGSSKSFFFDTRSRGPEPVADGADSNEGPPPETTAVGADLRQLWFCLLKIFVLF